METFTFECLGCRKCCNSMNTRLSPKDILQICSSQQKTTEDFLKEDVTFIKDKKNNLTLPFIKKRKTCPYLNNDSCSLEANKPFECKIYPLGYKTKIEKGEAKLNFFLRDSQCEGFFNGNEHTPRSWIYQQDAHQEIKFMLKWSSFLSFMLMKYQDRMAKDKKLIRLFTETCFNHDGELYQSLLQKYGLEMPKEENKKSEFILDTAIRFFSAYK